VSKVNDIKNLKRQQKVVTPTQALAEVVGEEENKEKTNKESKVERKRITVDIRTELYKQWKMQSLIEEKNMYSILEEALETYLKVNK
jgi:hypothetical protein